MSRETLQLGQVGSTEAPKQKSFLPCSLPQQEMEVDQHFKCTRENNSNMLMLSYYLDYKKFSLKIWIKLLFAWYQAEILFTNCSSIIVKITWKLDKPDITFRNWIFLKNVNSTLTSTSEYNNHVQLQ